MIYTQRGCHSLKLLNFREKSVHVEPIYSMTEANKSFSQFTDRAWLILYPFSCIVSWRDHEFWLFVNVTGRRWGLDHGVDCQPLRGTVEQHRGKRLAQTQTGGNLTRLHAFTSHMPMNSAEETMRRSCGTVAIRQPAVFSHPQTTLQLPWQRGNKLCNNYLTCIRLSVWTAAVLWKRGFPSSAHGTICARWVLWSVSGAWYQLGHSFVHVTWRCVL